MLKLQYFGHLLRRTDSLEKALMLGKNKGRRRREWQRMRWWMASLTQCTWIWANSKRRWRTVKSRVLQSRGLQSVRHDWATEHHFFFFLMSIALGSFPVGSEVENTPAHAGDSSSILGSGRSFTEGNDNPLQYSCLENHGQRRVTDYSLCVHRRGGHDLETKRHRFIEQSFRLCGRRRGWDVSREQHQNMYII